MKNYLLAFLFLLSSALTTNAFAFPEMIRQHYVNCTACHESPSGGGLLTPYGRGLSSELLSTWGDVKEARAFYGAIDQPWLKKWFNAGADFRGVEFHQKSSQGKTDKFIRMQTGVETALKYEKFKFVSFFGKQEDTTVKGEFLRLFLQYQPLDQLSVRAGRFIPNFGINIAEHILATRRGLNFDEGSERDQIEVMWSGEQWNSSMAYSKQVRSDEIPQIEKAANAQLNYTFFDSYRIGGDLWFGDQEGGATRQIYGAHALLGFTKQLYYLTEFDFQKGFDKHHGLYHFSKFGYEFIKGLHAIVLEDYQKSNLSDGNTLANSYGAGLEWYPRPHFDFEGVWSKKRVAAQASDYADYAYLMMHYYF